LDLLAAMKIVIGIIVTAVAVLVIYSFGDRRLPGDIEFGRALQSLLYGAAVTMAASLLFHYRGRLSTALLSVIAWVAIFGVVIVGYAYRNDLQIVATRVMDEVVPGRSVASGPGQAVAVRGRNGHFFLTGIANGKRLPFLFDTGASAVVLTAEAAQQIGIPPAKLKYSARVSTANGTAMAAPFTIDALTIGDITLRDVRALVAAPGALRDNLLGMSFLGRLTSYTVRSNRLILSR
jgi:aspartyl protease family protein